MKTIRLAGIILLAFLTIGFASCNKDNNGNNINDEIIEYQGEYPAPENIEYVEGGVTYEIEAIPGQIIISADVDHNTVVNAVKANGGTIIQQYPQYGDYLVEVAIGSENSFITAMNNLNITADLNIVEYPKEKFDYFVFDDFIDAAGIQHGRKVSDVLSTCQNTAVINELNIYTSQIPNWVPLFGGVALNIGRFKFSNLLSQNQVLVNWSSGAGDNDADWQSMTEEQKQNFRESFKISMKMKLDKILWLKRMSPGIDIVFAQAAGNERCPEISQMINELKSNPKYKTVLEENVIFVSDHSTYANTSSQYGDFCYINEHPYYNPNGGTTSYATPQALCYINQVIKGTIGEDGKNITAVQALAAVKAAIRQNSNGELNLDEALEMARNIYSPITNGWDGTSWDFRGLLTTNYSWGYSSSDETGIYLYFNSISNNDNVCIYPSVFDLYNEKYIIDGNGRLVYTSESEYTEDDGFRIHNNYQITFVRTGPTSATADYHCHSSASNGTWEIDSGSFQGTLNGK